PATSPLLPYTPLFRSEGSLRQFFVDDADLGALGCIRLVEFPTGDERNAHRRKVIWANVVIHGVGIVSGTIAFGCEVGTNYFSTIDRKSTRLNSSHQII